MVGMAIVSKLTEAFFPHLLGRPSARSGGIQPLDDLK
jgi:hypothetical protein